ncbi:MAG: YIP1 family protein [Pseudomonadales bacterium]|nr:YIP1 family protein [Pseudomonadales bacterium]
MFNPTETIELVKNALLNPKTSWDDYLSKDITWQDTAIKLTLPLIIASAIAGLLLASIFANGIGIITRLILSVVMMSVSIGMSALIINFFAGQFGGKAEFNRAFAAVSLTVIPMLIGHVVGVLPWLGWLISVGLGIYSAVLLYQVIPLALSIPDESRTKHYIVSVICMFIATLIVGAVLGGAIIGGSVGSSMNTSFEDSYQYNNDSSNDNSPITGMFSGMQKNADYAEQAESDRYSPPSNGKLKKRQVITFISVMQKTRDLQSEYSEGLSALSEDAEDDNTSEPSLTDVFKAISDTAGIGFSEMKVVKTGGLNWAEHQWVREQLDIARIQKDINEAVVHNYALYMENADELKKYL